MCVFAAIVMWTYVNKRGATVTCVACRDVVIFLKKMNKITKRKAHVCNDSRLLKPCTAPILGFS
jgi:hypothetical protein